MIPLTETSRIRLLPESAMKISPALSTERPAGDHNCALTADPPSPEYPALEFPATCTRTPLLVNLNTQFVLVKYAFPLLSVATFCGAPIDASVATFGVGGAAPPA